MKRREVEIFMAVKEAGDFVINSMKRGKTVRVNNESIAYDINKKLRLINIYQQIIEELNADVAPNKLDLTAEELECMVNNYIEKNCDNIKIVHETIDVESHAVVYRVA